MAGHEEHLKNYGNKIGESEQNLKDLSERMSQAEEDRERARRLSETTLQRHWEELQRIPRKDPGNEPIHQYKDFKTVRGYRFMLQGEVHKIEVAHSRGLWQMALDGQVVQ